VARAREILTRRGGVILADDVGLGKSFVAAAIAAEFASVQLIVPASLVAQWRETLRMFDAEAEIVTHDTIRASKAELVIVDEAHAFRNPATRRYDALARSTIAAKLMLVTATPVCNSARDLEALIGLIARDDLLMDCGVPSIDLAFATRDVERVVHELVIRRDQSVLPPELAFGALERKVVRHRVPEARVRRSRACDRRGGGGIELDRLGAGPCNETGTEQGEKHAWANSGQKDRHPAG